MQKFNRVSLGLLGGVVLGLFYWYLDHAYQALNRPGSCANVSTAIQPTAAHIMPLAALVNIGLVCMSAPLFIGKKHRHLAVGLLCGAIGAAGAWCYFDAWDLGWYFYCF